MRTITQAIDIATAPERVWDVLVADKTFREIEYDGVVVAGQDDTDSAEARQIQGARVTYRLTATPGGTHLAIAGDMGEEYYDSMAEAWVRALAKVKALAETP